jgi:copper chaperone CopZ
MTCPGCAATIKRALQNVDGVVGANVSYEEGAATLRVTANASLSDVLGTIEKLGYHGSLRPGLSPMAASSVSDTGVPSS